MNIPVTAETLTDEQFREFIYACMPGSPLYEDCSVVLGWLQLDGGDPDDDDAMARARIADAINARKEK